MKRNSRKWVLATVAASASMFLASGFNGYAKTTSPVQVNWFSDVPWWTVTWDSKNVPVESVITQKTGVEFNIQSPPQDADTKLNLMMATGKLPDVITLQNYDEVQQLAKSGKIWTLTDLMKKYDPGFLKTFPKGLVEEQKQNFGAFYGIPSYATSNDQFVQYPQSKTKLLFSQNQAIVFNQYLMKQAGISMSQVKTENGLIAALKKIKSMNLKSNGASVIPLQVDTKDGWYGNSLDSLAAMFGAMAVDKQGNYRPLYFSPEEKHAIDFFFKLTQAGILDPSQFTLDTTANNAAVTSGRVFAFLGNTGNPQWASMWSQNHNMTWASPGNILSSQGTQPVYGYANYAGWTFTTVSKTCPNPAAVAKWIDYMWSPEGQRLAQYGIEGKDWKFGKYAKVYQNQATVDKLNKDSNYWLKSGIGSIWFFYNGPYLTSVTPASTSVPNTMINTFRQSRATTKPVHVYDADALTMPTSLIPPGTSLYQQQQQIIQYWQAQVPKMIFASTSADENSIYQDTIRQMKKMGLDQIDSLMNKQFHANEKAQGYTLKGLNS